MTLFRVANLTHRWNVQRETVTRRLVFLGIKATWKDSHSYIDSQQLKYADDLHHHLLQSKPYHAFTKTVIEKENKNQEGDRYGKVYFVGDGDLGPVKIGFSSQSDLKSRLGQLQTASPNQLEIIGSFDGYVKNEQKVHRFLAPHRLRGEWFEREAALAVYNCICSKRTMPNSTFVEDLFYAASSVHDPRKSSEEDEADEDSLPFHVAHELLSAYYSTIKGSAPDQPLPLRAWLLSQTERDCPTGDLAKDVKDDPGFPAVASLPEYLEYIRYVASSSAVTRTVVDAWVECRNAILALDRS
jgi:hypothetical protein